MKKTLLITSNFYPVEGGIGVYLGVYFHLPKEKVVVLAPKEGDYGEFDKRSGVKTYRSLWMGPPQRWKRLLRYIFLPLKVWDVIRRERIEAVHIANIGTVPPTLLIPIRLLRIPFLCFAHGVELFKTRRSWARRFLDQSSIVLANSTFTEKVLQKRFEVPAAKVVVFHPGIDPQLLKSRPKTKDLEKKYKTVGKFTLLTVSRIVWRKGHETVLRALAIMRKKGFEDFRYLIVGRGRREEDVRKVVSDLSLEPEVEFVGYVGNESLPDFYELCDVFVMVPRDIDGDYEGFGIVYLEAGAFKKPVVGSKSGGVPDAVLDGETGFIVEPDNPEELARVLLRLSKDESLRKRLGREGFIRARSSTWVKIAPKFKKILELRDF